MADTKILGTSDVVARTSGNDDIFKYGDSFVPVSTTESDIWDGCADGITLYTWPTAPETLYVSSSDNADTADVSVTGHDASRNEQVAVQAVAGQTKTEIGSGLTWMRTYRAFNSDSTDLAGDVYIYADSTTTAGVPDDATKIRAKITAGINQSYMTIYSIPANYSRGELCEVIISGAGTLELKKDSLMLYQLWTRLPGGVWRSKVRFRLANMPLVYHPRRPRRYPPMTDFRWTATRIEGEDASVSLNYCIELIP